MTVTISQIVGTTWTTLASNTLMDFGTLSYNSTLGIYTAPHYFAVDVGVLNNSGSWSIQHTPSSIFNTTTGNTSQNLDGKINVTFMQQINATSDSPIANVSFAGSNRAITNVNIPSGSWLRVYYGLGTGSGDNTGVTPIVSSQTAGTYQGSVTLTLTP